MRFVFRLVPARRGLVAPALALAAALCLAAAPSHAQRVEERRFQDLREFTRYSFTANPDMHDALRKWMTAVNGGDSVAALTESNRVGDLKNLLGTRNLLPVSDFFIAFGRQAEHRGDHRAARLAAQNAVAVSPDSPHAHFFMAHTAVFGDSKDVNTAVTASLAGARAALSDRFSRNALLAHAAPWVLAGLLAAFAGTFVIALLVEFRAAAADITSRLPVALEGPWRVAAAALAALIPLAAGGWVFMALAAPLLLWPYLRRGGQVVVILFTLFALGAPMVVEWVGANTALRSAEAYRAAYFLSKETWDFETRAALEKERARTPNDELTTFALGLLNKLARDKDAALAAYDALLAKNPAGVRALVNKGNVYFAFKDWPAAADMYRQAIAANTQTPEAHYNLSKAYTEMFLNKESDAAYQQARAIDPKKTDGFRDMSLLDPERKVVDFPITADDLRAYERRLDSATQAAGDAMWKRYFGNLSRQTFKIATGAYLLLLLLVFALWSRSISSVVCHSCGAVFQPPIRLEAATPTCTQCVAAQSTRGAVSSAKKDKKRKEMRDYKDLRGKVASALDRALPGAGRVYSREPLSGLPFMMVTSLILMYAGVALWGAVSGAPRANPVTDHSVFLAAAALYWILMNTALMKDYY